MRYYSVKSHIIINKSGVVGNVSYQTSWSALCHIDAQQATKQMGKPVSFYATHCDQAPRAFFKIIYTQGLYTKS